MCIKVVDLVKVMGRRDLHEICSPRARGHLFPGEILATPNFLEFRAMTLIFWPLDTKFSIKYDSLSLVYHITSIYGSIRTFWCIDVFHRFKIGPVITIWPNPTPNLR